MSHYALGIDTGGTFTDGVIFDLESEKIISKTKVITTRYNLSRAVVNCLDNLLEDLENKGVREQVIRDLKMSCLSTTLATNATVEGQGADVGLILIGVDIDQDLPTSHSITIAGGCDIEGREKDPVDLDAARAAIGGMSANVETFAVSGYMSIRNPQQELAVSGLIQEMTGYPVVCGHQLSGDLGVYERTVTAVLNARLIPLIAHLIDAVRESLQIKSISAPLRIVKGDGSLISEKTALEKPIETILSGPAASLIGAKVLSRIEDGIVVDIGGTTTDIAVLKKGRPILRDEGAKVGGWLTRVKAAEITTIGLGGDSLIQVSGNGILSVGPQKVFPLSWSVSEYPYLLDELQAAYDCGFSPLDAQPTCTLFFSRYPDESVLQESEKEVLELIREEPHTLFMTGNILGKEPALVPWKRLVNLGAIHRGNLTPTDILHVRGTLSLWNKEAAVLGTELLVKRYKKGIQGFIDDIMDIIGFRLFSVLLEKMLSLNQPGIDVLDNTQALCLMKQMFSRDRNEIQLSARISLPVIGVGAPVQAYLPDVVKRFHGKFILTDDADVANAAGTVNGRVIERVKVLVKPGETGGFFIYSPSERKFFTDFDDALNYAEKTGREIAYKRAVESGGWDIHIETDREDRYIPFTEHVEDESGKLFVESIMEISAIGIPWNKENRSE